MKLSVSAYRAHASAHKKILDTAYQLNYGSVSASHLNNTQQPFKVDPLNDDPPNAGSSGNQHLQPTSIPGLVPADNSGSDTPLHSPRSPINTSRDEDEDSSNPNSSDCKSPSQRQAVDMTKSNQRWMKLRTTVQISSAIQSKVKKPPLKREDSFLKRFSTRQIPEAQETVEDTGSEGGANGGGNGDPHSTPHRRRRRIQKSPRSVVNPDENFYFYWLLVLTICVLYNLWTSIVRQSFPEFQTMLSNFWLACDSISDLVFLCDVGVQLRTGYLEQGLMVYDSKKLAGHYLHSRPFLLDLGALCPLDLLQVRLGPQPMLRFPRFLKVYRAVNYYYMVESRTVWPNLWRVVNLIHILLILAHWFGCFYFLLSEAEGFQGDWVYPYRPGDYATLTRKYLGSLYWSTLTLTTIGDLPTPETNAEYVFTIVSYLIGVFIFATIVGQVGNVITNRNANRLEFERLLDGAKTYMRHHKVPSGMKKRVLRWYDYSWSRGRIQGGGDINTALGLLPDKLKTELALHVNLSVLKKVTIFQECQPEFLHDLVLKMKAYIFTPGDSICRKGEVAREMFIIADGILEVISEAGRVLTTMKAGDFFGEIGILNLDGLNKRTADVRSVGYSELFSLSREDVLAAMKDYPEAQEILQALGRKRLMEVRKSAHQHEQSHRKHHDNKNHGSHRGPVDPRGLVGKIKNEAKGLRNVLRKSRTHRRSDDSLELQPLHTPSKGVLRRMPRVRSDDLSQEEASEQPLQRQESVGKEPIVTSPLGAGLPLLSRLRLLKEKQENEERASTCHITSSTHSPSNIISPATVLEEPPQEVIGAGLPLLQRLLLLKAKEAPPTNSSQTPSPIVSPKPNTNKVSFKDRIASELLGKKDITPIPSTITTVISPPKLVSPPPNTCSPVIEQEIELSSEISEVKEEINSDVDKIETPDEMCPWSILKQNIVRDSISSGSGEHDNDIVPVLRKLKPNLLDLENRTKQYESVDDLSPEYCGLPFVKKLKILNERQKLAELEHVMKARSVSLDLPCDSTQHDDTMTRSRSEASAMHSCNTLDVAYTENQGPTSPESNETLERRNLKSILKKLSEDPPILQQHTPDLRQLMRAQTIEGYAARHSKLSKSVTFNRDTLQSPPNSANLIGGNGNLNLFPLLPMGPPSGEGERERGEREGEKEKDLVEKCRIQIISSAANQVKLLKGPFEQEQEYFGEVLVAIKQVISGHLQEMQDKFQQRFEKLEDEVRSRDEVINRLRNHITELEKTLDDSYTTSAESVDTVISHRSWDEPNNQECLEIQDLPESISPQQSWPSQSVVLELDSATDTESELGDSSSQEGSTYNTDWELQMLADQMRRQRRSASFDQNCYPENRRSTPQARRRLCRGYSADTSRRD